jgi:hypothetical protein
MLLVKGFRKPGATVRHTNESCDWNDPKCLYIFARVSLEEKDRVLKECKDEFSVCPRCGKSLGRDGDETLGLYLGNILDPNPEWSYFYAATECLTEESAKNLRNAFEHWAIPILEEAKMVMAKYVSPQTYEDIAKLFMERKEEHDNGNSSGRPELQG